MNIRNVLLRALFCIGLLLFVISIFSPWTVKRRLSIVPGHFSGEEYYWSFQVAFYSYKDGEWTLWDFWFTQARLFLWDFWFTRDMYYYGFTFEWIRLFVFQLSTVFSGIFVLVKKWQKTNCLLIPFSFSTLSVLLGMLQVNRFMFVWNGYAHLAWGLPLAFFATLCFLSVFLVRYVLQKLLFR